MSHVVPSVPRVRSARRALALLTGLLAAAGLVVAVSGPAQAAPSVAAGFGWARTTSACATPTDPAAIRCFAQKLVAAPAGAPGAKRAAAIGHGPTGGYSPWDLAKAYGYNPKASVHQTIALVNWYDDPYALADLNHFNAHYGLPKETATSFRKVNQAGRTSPLPKASRDSAGEITLDIQAARAVCMKCRIILVEANSPSSASLAAAENTAARLGATEISNSWGGQESGGDLKTLQPAFYHPGVVITASTGDDGWRGWGYGDTAPSYPSTSPQVVAVSGTRLVTNSAGARTSERVWSSSVGATGGGCSGLFTPYGWQSHTAGYAALGCKGHRAGADVSALADPQYGLDVFDRYGTAADPTSGCVTSAPTGQCWGRAGGTSLSSPVVAALFALAGGSGGSQYPAASLYVNAARRPGTVYDVQQGGNGACSALAPYTTFDADAAAACADNTSQLRDNSSGTNNPNYYLQARAECSFNSSYTLSVDALQKAKPNPECNAAAGFDGATGLGAPRGLGMFTRTSPSATASAAGTQYHGVKHTYTATVRPVVSGSRITSVTWNFGDGHSATGTRVTHAFAARGRHTVTMVAIDSLYQRVLRTVTVTVK